MKCSTNRASDASLVSCLCLGLTATFLCGSVIVCAGDTARSRKGADKSAGTLPPAAIARLGTTVLRHTPRSVETVAYSPRGDLFATGSSKALIVWNAASGTVHSRIDMGGEVLTSMAFFPDGIRLAFVTWVPSARNRVWIFNVTDNSLRTITRPLVGDHPLVAVSPDGRFVAFDEKDQSRTVKVRHAGGKEIEQSIHQIHLWDTKKQSVVQKLDGPTLPWRMIAFSPDSKLVAVAASSPFITRSEPTPVHIWDTGTGKRVGEYTGHSAGMCSLAFSPDSSILAGGGGDRKIHFWEVKTGKYLTPIVTDSADEIAWSPHDNILASWSMSGLSAYLWNPKTGKLIRELTKEDERCRHLVFSPDGKQIVTTGNTPTIRIRGVATGKEVLPSNGHTGWIYSLVFSPSGNLVSRQPSFDG